MCGADFFLAGHVRSIGTAPTPTRGAPIHRPFFDLRTHVQWLPASLGWLLATACAPAPAPSTWATDGCDWIEDACHLHEDTDLVVWLGGTGAHGVTHLGEPVDFSSSSVESGVRMVVTAPVAPGTWTFALGGTAVQLEVERGVPVERPACEDVQRALEAGVEPSNGEGWARAAACARRSGALDAMTEHLERAIEAHAAAGEHSRQARRTAAWAHARLEAHAHTSVRARLEVLDPRDGNGRWIRAHYQARLLEAAGQARAAEAGHHNALRWAQRLAIESRRRNSLHALAYLASESGDLARARALLDRVLVRGRCAGIDRWIERNALTIDLREAVTTDREERVADVAERFEAMLVDGCPTPPAERADLAVDAAMARSFLGHHDAALAHLEAAATDEEALRPYTLAWVRWIQARALGEADAFLAAADTARSGHNREVELRALTERATLLSGDDQAARDAFDEAMAVAEAIAAALPWERERGAWTASLATLVGARIEHELRQGRPDEALAQLRAARSLAQRSIQRDAIQGDAPEDTGARTTDLYWTLRDEQDMTRRALATAPADELPGLRDTLARLDRQLANTLDHELRGVHSNGRLPALVLGPGEVVLASWPHDGRRFLFRADADGVTARLLPRIPKQEAWRDALDELLGGARSVRVLGLGPDEADVLASFTTALGDRVVRWSLDLDTRRFPTRSGHLIVGDPTGDLPAAREEAMQLATSGDRLLLGDAATVHRVLAALQRVRTAHLAGHARHLDDTPAASHLVLADGTLRASDVLALDQVPAQVFLAGCATGRSHHQLGLAQAFVAAGTDEVIASDRVVSDEETRLLVDAWMEPAARNLPAPERLAHARRMVRSKLPSADWTAWRIWTP